jgi:Rrf2 family protein
MLSLSQTTGYAILALTWLNHERPRLIREVAEGTGIVKPYLAKIFNLLANKGLLVAKRGYRGGIQLARPADKISLFEIVEATEGDKWMSQCLLGMRECNAESLCPTHDLWQEMKNQIRDALERITLSEVRSLARSQIRLPHLAGSLPNPAAEEAAGCC